MNFLNLGPTELAVIGVIALVVLGPRKLPELGKMVGRWMKTVREASDEMKRGLYLEDDFRSPPPRPKSAPAIDHTPSEDDEPADIVDTGVSAAATESETTAEGSESSKEETTEEAVAEEPAESEDDSSAQVEYRDNYPYEEDEDYD
jgi:TatA/E family protein of Tat protein translocase